MTLKQIDERLALFPEYLRYWIEARIHPDFIFHVDLKKCSTIANMTPKQMIEQLNKQGWVFIDSIDQYPKTLSFDQWLYQNKHEDLVG